MNWYEKNIFPTLLDKMMMQGPLMEMRVKLLKSATGNILDVGIGTGVNLLTYPDEVRSLSVTSKHLPLMEKAQLRAKMLKMELTAIQTNTTPWPLADNSMDTVVMCMTLCSVESELDFLLEIKRVLKPTGRLLFMEHGLSPRGWVRTQEKLYNPLNKLIGCGCSMTKRPVDWLQGAGFDINIIHEGYLPELHRVGGYMFVGEAKITNMDEEPFLV